MKVGFTLNILEAEDIDRLICIDCARCGATICEASPDTIERDPRWLIDALMSHELGHANAEAITRSALR